MKYSVEIENGTAKETLVFNDNVYVKTTKKTNFGSSSDDMDFSEQMGNEGIDTDVLDRIHDALDGFLADELLDIAESEE